MTSVRGDPPAATAAPAARKRGPDGRLIVLMITAFIDMAGLLMVIPLLPFYADAIWARADSA